MGFIVEDLNVDKLVENITDYIDTTITDYKLSDADTKKVLREVGSYSRECLKQIKENEKGY